MKRLTSSNFAAEFPSLHEDHYQPPSQRTEEEKWSAVCDLLCEAHTGITAHHVASRLGVTVQTARAYLDDCLKAGRLTRHVRPIAIGDRYKYRLA